MTTKAQKTYVDVTQLVHWPGKLAGIPRVMYELATRFRKNNPDAVFVSWVKELQDFCEIDLDRTLAHRGKGIDYRSIHDEGEASAGESPVQEQPDGSGLKKGATRVLKAGIARSRKLHPGLVNKLERRAQEIRMRHWKRAAPQKADVILILWGEWWDDNFLTKLENEAARGVHITTLIHDIGPMVTPQFSAHSTESLSAYCRRVVPICSLVLCVSEHGKKDLVGWLKQQRIPVPRVEVFRLGDDFEAATSRKPIDPAFTASRLKGDDYIMCVGTIELKKNQLLFYYVYYLAQQRGIELPKVVIVGRRGWRTETAIEVMTTDPSLKDKFVFLFDEGDEGLSWLYDHCMFTVLPSFHEGWGIPIAESLSRGVPCACSNTSSMVEIAPGITEHFSPASADECLSAIQKWLDPKELTEARKRTQQYKGATWNDSYRQTEQYLQGL
jgi:glycosyltransferase involved in cell wall biosynthesis